MHLREMDRGEGVQPDVRLTAYASGSLYTPVTIRGHERRRRRTWEALPGVRTEAVASGYYPGFYPIRDLKRHGDFGMGVFDRVDGEMIYWTA